MQDTIAGDLYGFDAVPFDVTLLRLVSAVVLGACVGFEREWRAKPAGIKTHFLVSLAACLFILVGRELALIDYGGGEVRIQPFGLIEAVTAGVAFLAAGLIFRADGRVQNVPTGASLCLAGAIGLASGAGQVPLAALATALTLFVLLVLRLFDRPHAPRSD